MYCCMELFGVVKRTKVLPEAAVKQFDVLLPDEYKKHYMNAMDTCKGVVAGIKDLCELGFAITKCFQGSMPTFFFP